jgi:hypothetical protein
MNQVNKQLNVSFIDSFALPSLAPVSYKIQAVDICGYRVYKDSLDVQTTVFLQRNVGFMKVDLQWTNYVGKIPAEYLVYRSKDGGAYSMIASVSNTTFNYTDTTAYCPTEYVYKIVAVDLNSSNYKSNSNDVKAFPSSDIGMQEVRMKRTTVVENNYTLTEWLSPSSYPWLVDRYQIWRSDDNINFRLIADVPSVAHEYEDHSVDVQNHEFYYRVTAYTECGTSESSESSSSIWLQAHEFDSKSFLKWTPYKEWVNGVDSYRIEKLNSSGIWEELRTVPGNVIQVAED